MTNQAFAAVPHGPRATPFRITALASPPPRYAVCRNDHTFLMALKDMFQHLRNTTGLANVTPLRYRARVRVAPEPVNDFETVTIANY